MRRVIKWQSQHLEINTLTGKLQDPPEFEDEYDDEYYDDEMMGPNQQRMPIQNVMSTPFGFWRVDDAMNPFKQFKMWLGHTNFTITPEIVEVIKAVPGVEVLQIMTRYRFIIGVGELFDIHDVRVTIENELECNRDETDMISDQKLLEQVFELREQLSMHDQWAIYVFPNGEIDFTTSDEDNFGQQLNLYRQAVDHSNGVLIESDNE
jgi:hypothetical protein